MDRNELAARFAVALAPSYYGQGYGDDDLARDAAHKADTLMSVLAESSKSTPAPVAPPAGKYVPAVGDIVRYSDDDEAEGDKWHKIVVRVEGVDVGYKFLRDLDGSPLSSCSPGNLRYLRDSTPAERAAAGLPTSPPSPAPEVLTPDVPEGSTIAQLAAEQRASMGATQHFKHDITPAPEAKRPTHVRITGPKDHRSVTIGKVYEVLYFDDDRARLIIKNDDGVEWGLSNKPDEGPAFPTWAPAPCPPPVAGSEESADLDAILSDCLTVVDGQANAAHPDSARFTRMFELAKRIATARAALSRPVRP